MFAIADLFWVALGMALMFGLWFGALSLRKGMKAAWTFITNLFTGRGKALHAHIDAVHTDIKAIKTKVGA